LSSANPGQVLSSIFARTRGAELKKLTEIVMTTQNEQKFKRLKDICFPNFVLVTETINQICVSLEEAMMETVRMLAVDGFTASGSAFVSWKEMNIACQSVIDAENQRIGAAAAAAAAAVGEADARMG